MTPTIHFYVPSFGIATGGAEVQAMNLAGAIVAKGKFKVEIISRSGVFQSVGDKFVFLNEFKTTDKKTWLGDIHHVFQVLSYLRRQREKFRLIHFHSISQMSMFLGCLLLLASKFSYSYELIYKVTRTGTSAPIASNMRRPCIVFAFFYIKSSTLTIILTEFGHDELVNLGVEPDEVVLIPNGINVALWRSGVEWKERKNIYLVVSRLIQRKNVVEIIRAWGKSNGGDTRQLLIVGDGPEVSNLRDVASLDQFQPDKVLRSPKPGTNPQINEASPILYIEFYWGGIIQLLIGGHGVWCGADNQKNPSNSAVVDDTINGFLYSSSDDLARFLALTPEQSKGGQLSASSLKKVETCFAMEGVVEKYIALISTLINLER